MIKIGDTFEVYANQGMREAVVLAVVMKPTARAYGQALVEYVMPEGRTFLRILNLDESGEPYGGGEGRPCSYDEIPVKFLNEMRANFSAVLGLLRAGFDNDVPTDYARRRHRPFYDRAAQLALKKRMEILDLNPKEAA